MTLDISHLEARPCYRERCGILRDHARLNYLKVFPNNIQEIKFNYIDPF